MAADDAATLASANVHADAGDAATLASAIRTVNRVAVGVGAQNGRAAFTIGGAFSGDEKSAGVGYGIGW